MEKKEKLCFTVEFQLICIEGLMELEKSPVNSKSLLGSFDLKKAGYIQIFKVSTYELFINFKGKMVKRQWRNLVDNTLTKRFWEPFYKITNQNSPKISSSRKAKRGFSGGSVVNNLPANAGDTGSIPGLGRSHMPGEAKPLCHNYWSPISYSLCCESREATAMRSLYIATREKTPRSSKDPEQPKVNK